MAQVLGRRITREVREAAIAPATQCHLGLAMREKTVSEIIVQTILDVECLHRTLNVVDTRNLSVLAVHTQYPLPKLKLSHKKSGILVKFAFG
jgi:hypothetical protein